MIVKGGKWKRIVKRSGEEKEEEEGEKWRNERKWREVHGEELGQPMTFFAISNRGDTRRRLEEIIIPQRAL